MSKTAELAQGGENLGQIKKTGVEIGGILSIPLKREDKPKMEKGVEPYVHEYGTATTVESDDNPE